METGLALGAIFPGPIIWEQLYGRYDNLLQEAGMNRALMNVVSPKLIGGG